MMDRDFFMNAGIQPPQQLDTAMGMNFIGLNFLPEQAFMEPNSSVNQYSQFQSALMSSMASSTPGLSNDAFALRELIGKLGGDSVGNFHPPSASTPYESCQSTPHKPHLPILDHVNRANLGNPVPLASLSTDPEFAVRAAKFSCFGSRSFNGRTAPIGLNNGKFLSRSGSPLKGSGKLPRVASSPVLKQQVGSPLPQIEIRANNGVSLSPGSEKKLSKLSCSGANSNEESSVSEQIPSGDTRPKTSNELNSRKRKAVSRGKPKEDGAKEVGGEDDGIAKCPKTESEKIENVGAKTEEEAKKEGSNEKSTEPFKDYIHVRARRGQATDSHSLAERVRREKIGERMKLLQDLVPGCNKVTGKALMLDEIINYVQSLQRQVEFLSMKLASVNPELDFNMNNLLTKDMYPLDSSSSAAAVAFFNHHHQSHQNVQSSMDNVQLGIQLPSLDGFSASLPQFPAFGEDDLHSIVNMGFGQNSLNFPVPYQLSDMKTER